MAFDGLMMSALRSEFKSTLVGARVEKVTQPQKDEVVLFLHCFDAGAKRSESLRLLLCANPSYPRVHLTRETRENPAVAPNFCMLLRKHIAGARLTDVRGYGTERVMEFVFEGRSEMGDATVRRLIVEIMGRGSNLILAAADGRIFDCLHQTDIASGRALLPGMTYEMPAAQGKMSLEEAAFLPDAFFDDGGRADKKLCASVLGFSPTLAREIVFRAAGATDAVLSTLDASQRDTVRREIADLSARLAEGRFEPCVVMADKPVEFCFMPLRQYGQEFSRKTFSTCSEAANAFYAEKASLENRRRAGAETTKLVETHIARLSRKVEAQRGELEECDKADEYRRYGDALTASLWAVEKGASSVRLTDYYADPPAAVTIPLDPRLSPSRNAQRYYKLYKKAQTARGILQKMIPEALAEIDYLRSVLDAVGRAETQADLSEIRAELASEGYIKRTSSKRSPAPSKPMTFTSDDGFTILVGKNNTQNDTLTLRTARKSDVWFHTKNYPGSHVVVLCEDATAPDSTLTQAAILAATFSSASDGSNVEVDYTEIRHIRKPSGAKPGKVIYDTFRTAVVTPDRDLAKRLSGGGKP